MSITLSSRQWSPRLMLRAMQLAQRSTCKIAVELDKEFQAKLSNQEVKAKQHPGVVKANRLEVPAPLQKALHRVIGDQPVKALLKDFKKLQQYMQARHPPPEVTELRSRMRDVVQEMDEKMPPSEMAALSEEEGANWRRRREKAIKKVMAQRTYAWKPIVYGSYEALVYALGRGPLEYGVLLRILREIQQRDGNFKPRSYFDFGSGVGTGMWAASSLWRDSIFEYYNVDSSREMNEMSELLLRGGNDNQQITLTNVYYRQFLPGIDTKYDLIISAYSLFELPSAQSRREVLQNLWQKCEGYLILVEEGTRRGSELINEARDNLLEFCQDASMKGHVFAPCPHDLPCPRHADSKDETPCNFQVAYVPLRIGNVKDDLAGARYSYLVMKKGEEQDETRQWPRLVRETLPRSGHVICRMCTAGGKLQEITFTGSKHGKDALRCAKISRWGDRLPIAIGETIERETKTSKIRKASKEGSDSEGN